MQKLERVRELLAQCTEIAEDEGIEFYFSFNGVGQTYYATESDVHRDDWRGQWISSSEQC